MVAYLWYVLVEKFATRAPVNVVYAVARFLGVLRYWQWGGGRRAVRRNLAVIAPRISEPRLIKRRVLRTFVNFGLNIVEFFRFARFDREYFETHFEVFGEEHLAESLKRGRGAIVLSAHFGNWELGVAAYAARGYTASVVALPHGSERVERLFVRQRGQKGLSVLATHTAARPALRVLRGNGVLGMLGERLVGDDGVPVNFCGRRVLFPKGPGWLAVKSGAAIVPTIGIRKRDNTFTIISNPPILPPEEGTDEEKVLTVTQRFANFLEKYVMRYPELWATFFDFFTEQAAGGRGA